MNLRQTARHAVALALGCFLLCLSARAQPDAPPPQTFTLAGHIVNSVTGAPVPRVLVWLWGLPQRAVKPEGNPEAPPPPVQTHETLTDASGAFRFEEVAAGTWRLGAKRPGFEDWPEEGQAPLDARIDLTASREDLRVPLRPVTVITGRVADQDGFPVDGVTVQALRAEIVDGRKLFHAYGWAQTDDRGIYRLSNLWRGPYYLRVSGLSARTRAVFGRVLPSQATGESFRPVYYPNSPDLDSASPVNDAPGQELHADFTISMQAGASVHGVLRSFSASQPVKLELDNAAGEAVPARTEINQSTGEFEIADVAPGSYVVKASQSVRDETLSGEAPVTLAPGGASGLTLELAPGVEIPCRIRVQGQGEDGEPAADVPASIALEPVVKIETAIQEPISSQGGENTPISLHNVPPGKYRVEVSTSTGYIAQLQAGSKDLLQNPVLTVTPGTAPTLDIVIQAGGATVSGRVQAASGNLAGAFIVLVSARSPDLPVVDAVASPDGSFSLSHVAPGSYRAYAWRGRAQLEYRNPSAMALAGVEGVEVEVGSSDLKDVHVPLAGGSAQ